MKNQNPLSKLFREYSITNRCKVSYTFSSRKTEKSICEHYSGRILPYTTIKNSRETKWYFSYQNISICFKSSKDNNNNVVLTDYNKQYNRDLNCNKDFYESFRAYYESIKSRISNETYKGYLAEISKLKKFRNRIAFKDIDQQFIIEYENYMLKTLNNKHNTVNKTFRRLKAFLNNARIMGLIHRDPFLGYRMLHSPTTREALLLKDFKKLERLQTKPLKDNQRNVLNAFLFACYTGLRFIDVKSLTKKNIVNGILVIKTSKTGTVVRIPLSKKAASFIIPKNGNLFRLYKNTKTNKCLQQLMKLARITKKVTFHIARHTFATLSLNLGIPMEVLSGLLGHTNIKTTQIYAKILDKTKINMIKKWDKLYF